MKAMPEKTKPEASLSPLLALLGGVTLGLSYLPLPLFWLAWAALVPMLVLWDRVEAVPRFLAEVYTAFLMAYALAFFWPMLHVYSEAPSAVFAGLLLVPLAWTLPFAVSLPYRLRYGRGAGFAVLVACYLAVELVFEHGPVAFPWPVLGLPQAGAAPLIQFAEFTGTAGLTLWVLLLNGLFFALFTARRRPRRLLVAFSFVLLVGASFAFGHWRRGHLARTARYVTVGLVQPALDATAWTHQYGSARLVHLTTLSDSLIAAMNAPPVFMIWPEMALPPAPNVARQDFVDAQLQAWVDRREVALLTGALLPDGAPDAARRFFDSAVLYRPHAPRQRYDQVHPTPSQAIVPLEEQAPWLDGRRRARFVKGTDQHILSFDDLRIGVLLDFEGLLGDYARRYPRRADFLVMLTRYGWWGRVPGYGQHLHHARLRAIETRRSVAQVALSGGTALIAPDGSVAYRSRAGAPAARLAAVPLYDGVTLYARFGNWLGLAAAALSLVLTGWIGLVGLLHLLRRPAAPPLRAEAA